MIIGAPRTEITSDNASGAVKVTGRAFVDPANDLYGNIQTIRWNRSRLIRITNFTATSIRLLGQGLPGGLGILGIVVNGSLVNTLSVTNTDALPRWYTVTGLGTGSKTVDIYEDFQDRGTPLNDGIDGPAFGTYCLAVELPIDGTVVKLTGTTGIAAFGDSHVDGDATNPVSFNGWCGQLRRVAINAGWMLGHVGAGSSTLCGGGPTAAQTASLIHDIWADIHCTTKKFLMVSRPNDYADAYYGHTLTTSPTAYGTYLQAVFTALDSSDPGWTGILSRIPQGTGWGANAGGFTLDDYWNAKVTASTAGGRTNVQTFDKTVFTNAGLSLATDYAEASPLQVHMVQTGHDKVFGVVRTWYGL